MIQDYHKQTSWPGGVLKAAYLELGFECAHFANFAINVFDYGGYIYTMKTGKQEASYAFTSAPFKGTQTTEPERSYQ